MVTVLLAAPAIGVYTHAAAYRLATAGWALDPFEGWPEEVPLAVLTAAGFIIYFVAKGKKRKRRW